MQDFEFDLGVGVEWFKFEEENDDESVQFS